MVTERGPAAFPELAMSVSIMLGVAKYLQRIGEHKKVWGGVPFTTERIVALRHLTSLFIDYRVMEDAENHVLQLTDAGAK